MPAAMKAPRMTMAPATPQKRTLGCLVGSILKTWKRRRKTKRLSMESDSSIA
jgi:hypothetical protein